jgi:hypothetical protein
VIARTRTSDVATTYAAPGASHPADDAELALVKDENQKPNA